MAALWKYDQSAREWRPETLGNDPAPLGPEALIAAAGADSALIAGDAAHVRVNGEPLVLGIRLLRDHDAIAIGGQEVLFYSTETLPTVQRYVGKSDVSCARCKQPIVKGDSVNCPNCHAWYHQTGKFPCWTFAETCALCQQRTALDRIYSWSPEGI